MRHRRLVALWAGLALCAAVGGGVAMAALAERARVGFVVAPVQPPAPPPAAVAPVPSPAPEPEPVATVQPRRPRLPAGRSVRTALRRALLTGAIERRDWARWRATDRRARAALRRLSGARRAELASVVGVVDRLASGGQLTAGRMPLAFLTLERNVEVWTRRPFPAPRRRMTFGRDPAVFQYYAGAGVQHHPLGSAGQINALVQPCLRRREALDRRRIARARAAAAGRRTGAPPVEAGAVRVPIRCHEQRVRRALDRLAELSSRRGDFAAWEYLFDYGAGRAPWVSGMAQATAAQALARGAQAFDESRYRELAIASLGAFEAAPPLGVAIRDGGGRHYLMYSFDPGLKILNGFLQSLIGLHDVGELARSPRARRLFRLGERAARPTIRGYDTGAWSLYSAAGRESTLDYHRLVTGFLEGMCERTDEPDYCAPGRRFARYLTEPPEVRVGVSPRLRAGRRAVVAFRVSKLSAVRVSVLRGSRHVVRRALSVPRGRFTVPWAPARGGRYVVRVQATGPEGLQEVIRETVRVKARPKPKPKPEVEKPERRERAPKAKPKPRLKGELGG